MIRLADGTTMKVEPGSMLPKDLHPDFEYFSIPGESIAAAKDKHIFIRTTIAQRDVNVGYRLVRGPAETKHILECAGRSIRNAMPSHDRVYASMMCGERRGQKKWDDLVADFNIVMSDQLARGDTLRVLLDLPKVTDLGDGHVAIEAPVYLMKL